MNEEASISRRSVPESLTVLFRSFEMFCDDLHHAVLQIPIKPPWILFHRVVRLLLHKRSSPLFKILIISESAERQSLMKRGQRENFSDMTLGVKHFYSKKKRRFSVNYNSDKFKTFSTRPRVLHICEHACDSRPGMEEATQTVTLSQMSACIRILFLPPSRPQELWLLLEHI